MIPPAIVIAPMESPKPGRRRGQHVVVLGRLSADRDAGAAQYASES